MLKSPEKLAIGAIALAFFGVIGKWALQEYVLPGPAKTCELNGLRHPRAEPGWGVNKLTVMVKGVDIKGSKSFCFDGVRAWIIQENDLNPLKPDLLVGQRYTIPESVAIR